MGYVPKIIRDNFKKKIQNFFTTPGGSMGRNRVKSPPLKYRKLPIKLAKIQVLTKKLKCSVLYLFQITGENFSLIGALEGSGGGALFTAEGGGVF